MPMKTLQLAQTRALFQTAIRSLLLHKLRSLLTVIGLVFGVASVIVMLAVAEGANEDAQKQIESLGVNNVIVRSVKPSSDDKEIVSRGNFALVFGLTDSDLQRMQDVLPNVRRLTPQREYRQEARYRANAVDSRIVGVQPNYAEANGLEMARGRFIQQNDLKMAKNICVIGQETARKLFKYESPIGRSVQIRDHFFRVIGVTVYRTPSAGIGSSLAAQDYNTDVYIPATTDRSRIGDVIRKFEQGTYSEQRIEISQITVEVVSKERVEQTADLIDSLLAKYHPKKDYKITVPLDLLAQAKATQRIFNFVLGSTAAISLLVGGIGIMNIMLATVSERTQEIGIRRALGATQSAIVIQFIFETMVLSLIGTVIGLAMGMFSPFFVTLASGMNTKIVFWSPLVAASVSMLVDLTFGIYPARQAAKLDPIEALRRV